MRQYAVEKRIEAGEADLSARHAAYFTNLFATAAERWATTPGPAWLDAYAADTDNLRTALAWAFGAGGDPATGLRLVAASVTRWWELPDTPVAEGQRWFDTAAPHLSPDTPAAVRGWIHFGQSWRDFRFGDLENLDAARQAITLFRQADAAPCLGAALWRAGSALLTSETAGDAALCLQEAETVLRPLPPSKWLALTTVRLADLRFRQGAHAAALAGYQEGFALSRTIECWIGLITGGSNMAELLYASGEATRALDQLRGLRDEFPPSRRAPLMATLTAHLLMAGAIHEMIEVATEAILQAAAIGLSSALAWTLEAVALYAAMSGDLDTAAGLAGYARGVHPSIAIRAGSRKAVVEKLEGLLTAGLPSEQVSRTLAEGRNWAARTAAGRALRVLAQKA